jgi:DHA1 family tetracycline resistance protein-like MFS transporter
MRRSSTRIIFIIILIDMMGFGLILPNLPYYAEELGASPLVVGLLVAAFPAAQMIGAPLIGRFSDRYGRKPALIITSLGTFIGYLILGFASTLPLLFLSRIVTGVTGGNISVAQAYISDVTGEQDRAKGMGIIGAAFGIGLITGPAVGGLLGEYSFALPAFVAATMSLGYTLAVIFKLPESLTAERRVLLSKREKKKPSIASYFANFRRPRLGTLLNFRFFYGMALAIFTTIFPLYAKYQFNLTEGATGLILAYVGVLLVITQVGLIRLVSKKYSEDILLFSSCVVTFLAMLGWAFTNNVWVLVLILFPFSIASGIFNTMINTAVSKSVPIEEVGATLGQSTSVDSITRVLAPTLGGYLLGSVGIFAPGVFAAISTGWLVAYGLLRLNLKGGVSSKSIAQRDLDKVGHIEGAPVG